MTQQHIYHSPEEYYRLAPEEQAALQHWIAGAIRRSDTLEARTSYALKHDFQHEGFYVTNGQFKGAMLAAGYLPDNSTAEEWQFRIQPRYQVARYDKHPSPGYHPLQVYSLGHFDLRFAQLLASIPPRPPYHTS